MSIVISLLQFSRAVRMNAVSDMAKSVGLKWPPPPTISVKELVRTIAQPLQPTGLRLSWGLDGGSVAPDSKSVSATDGPIIFSWNSSEPGESQVNKATKWSFYLFGASANLSQGSPSTIPSIQTNLAPGRKYSWYVKPFNDFAEGPASQTYDFATVPAQGQQREPQFPPPRLDSVDDQGDGKFLVKGELFLASHSVSIRVTNTQTIAGQYFNATADSSGKLSSTVKVPVQPPGTSLAFSANDGRTDPADHTNTLWSNTITKTV